MQGFRSIWTLTLFCLPVGCSSHNGQHESKQTAAHHEGRDGERDEDGDEEEEGENMDARMAGTEHRSLLDEQATGRDVSFAAAADALPAGWKVEGTHQSGPTATWKVVADSSAPGGANVLALTSPNHESESTFNLCWTNQTRFENGAIDVSMKPISGREDQGGGLIWRVKDKDNYYICRANPLESNFRLYYVKDGTRHQLATASLPISSGGWHTIRIEQVGDRILCSFDGKQLLEARDSTIHGEGGIGLWTKSDAASEFAALKVASTDHEEGDERDEDEEHEHR